MSELEKEIQLNGNIRNSVWVTEKFKAGKLLINGDKPNEKAFEDFKTCVRVINDIYEKAWDISFYVFDSSKSVSLEDCTININGIYIFFPEITIRNAKKNEHTIKELIVKIEIYLASASSLKIGGILGGRFYLSYAEFQNDYYHSHLSLSRTTDRNIPAPYLGYFCTGSGEINMYQSELNGDGITEEKFVKYAMQIMTLVSYESIEGMPYRHMKNIVVRQGAARIFIANRSNIENFNFKIKNRIRREEEVPFNFYIDTEGLYRISNDETFKTYLESIPYDESETNSYFCTMDSNGNYYRYNTEIVISEPPIYNRTFLFRGEEKRLVVEKNPATDDALQHMIHPDFINNVIKDLEYELNKNKIRKSTIDRYTNSGGDARKSTKPNTIPVPANCES